MKQLLTICSFVLVLSVIAVAQEQPVNPSQVNPSPAVAAVGSTAATGGRFDVEKGEKDAAVSKGLKVEKKISGRLPNGYKSVVSASQKEDIYQLQKDYFELIELLKVRIELLEKELDAKVDALLDDNQKKTLRNNGQLRSEKKPAVKK